MASCRYGVFLIDWSIDQSISLNPMTSVGSYQAKTHLAQLLERVAKGESIVITRRGVPIAMLTQPPEQQTRNFLGVIGQMKKLRKGNTLGDDLSVRDLIDQGRRF